MNDSRFYRMQFLESAPLRARSRLAVALLIGLTGLLIAWVLYQIGMWVGIVSGFAADAHQIARSPVRAFIRSGEPLRAAGILEGAAAIGCAIVAILRPQRIAIALAAWGVAGLVALGVLHIGHSEVSIFDVVIVAGIAGPSLAAWRVTRPVA